MVVVRHYTEADLVKLIRESLAKRGLKVIEVTFDAELRRTCTDQPVGGYNISAVAKTIEDEESPDNNHERLT